MKDIPTKKISLYLPDSHFRQNYPKWSRKYDSLLDLSFDLHSPQIALHSSIKISQLHYI